MSPGWFAYDMVSVSRDDWAQIEENREAICRAIRALVAASEPCEEAALAMLHLIPFEPAGAGSDAT